MTESGPQHQYEWDCPNCGEHIMSVIPCEPPIAGMWVVESQQHELTPEIVRAVQDTLEVASAEGKQIIVVEGIEFRWRPTRVEAHR